MLQYIKIGQNPSFGSRGRCFLVKIWHSDCWCDLENEVLGHQNLITSFPCPNNVSMPVWSNSTHWFRRKMQTRSYADVDKIRTKSTMPPLPFVFCFFVCFFLVFLLFFVFCCLFFFFVLFFFCFLFFFCCCCFFLFCFFLLLFFCCCCCCCCFWGGGGLNLALIDPVVSEKMFEECGRRHRRACLNDKLTNQYIKTFGSHNQVKDLSY